MKKYKRPLKEEFSVSLEEVHRNWLRIPAAVILFPLIILVFILYMVGSFISLLIESIIFTFDTFIKCLKGPETLYYTEEKEILKNKKNKQ